MSRPFTRAQALENRAFLNALRRTANVRLACLELGVKHGTMQHRRRTHPAFAARWAAELAAAQARLAKVARTHRVRAAQPAKNEKRLGHGSESAFRTLGGETVIVRLKNGRLQVRRAQPGKLTREAEQAFLAALSATANVSLSAAAVGASPHAFYRRMKRNRAFARERRIALRQGYDNLELAMLESVAPGSREHDDWRNNEPPAMPPMSVNQGLQLMYLHQKEARLLSQPDHLKRRRGESREALCARLAAMAEEERRRSLEEFETAEVERWARGEPAWGLAGEEVRRELGLPDLAQVTGWSRADPAKAPHDPERALFGGWRLEQMEAKREEDGW